MVFKKTLSGDSPTQNSMNDGDDVINDGIHNELMLVEDLEYVSDSEDGIDYVDDDHPDELYDVDHIEGSSDEVDDDVVIPEFDHSTSTFLNHEGPVYACAFHPNGRIAASGCEEEMLYVWDSINRDILLEDKFQDSVTLVKFNHDGKYLAAADMLGHISCWKFSNNEFTKIKTMKLKCPSWMEWHPLANVLILAEKLYLCMWKVPTFETVKYFTLDSYSEAGCLMPDGKHALIGYDEGYGVILDLSTFTVSSKLKYHDMKYEHGIVSVDAHSDNNLVAMGTKKGRVVLFTSKKPKVIGILDMPNAEEDDYIEAIKFGRDSLSGLLLVAYSNYLNIYDHSKLVLRNQIVLTGLVVQLVCVEPLAYIATAKAVVEICDCRSGIKRPSLQGHCKAIMDITLSRDRRRLMTSSDDKTVKIFDLEPLSAILENRPGTSGQV